MKKCSECKQIKAITDFQTDRGNTDGKRSNCRQCCSIRMRERYKSNPYRYIDTALRKIYGITLKDKTDIFEAQNGCCAICLRPFKDVYTACVDHDHTTDIVRGLLCDKCNIAIGHLDDDPSKMHRAARYLNKARTVAAFTSRRRCA